MGPCLSTKNTKSAQHQQQHNQIKPQQQNGYQQSPQLQYGQQGLQQQPHEDKKIYFLSCHFNPQNYQNRNQLSQRFMNQFENFNNNSCQLIMVECIMNYPQRQQPVLRKQSNQIQLFNVETSSQMWIKENLLNIGLSFLPQTAKYIVWCDADIFFTENLEIVSQKIYYSLQQYNVVQLFEFCQDLGPDGQQVVAQHESLGSFVVKNKVIDRKLYSQSYPHPGYGWAAHRSSINLCGGLFDMNITGNGDQHMCFSFINRYMESFPQDNLEYLQQLLGQVFQWQQKVQSLGQVRVGFVNTNICHGWHGNKQDRGYLTRWQILIQNQFDFYTDITKNQFGVYEFTQKGRRLEQMMIQYFSQRNEDNINVLPNLYPQINGEVKNNVKGGVQIKVKFQEEKQRKFSDSISLNSDEYHDFPKHSKNFLKQQTTIQIIKQEKQKDFYDDFEVVVDNNDQFEQDDNGYYNHNNNGLIQDHNHGHYDDGLAQDNNYNDNCNNGLY